MFAQVALTLAIAYILWRFLKKPNNYPPGFWGLPLIGYIPIDGKSVVERLTDAQKRLGDVVMWRMGSADIVFLFDFMTIKKLFSLPEMANRPDITFARIFAPKQNLGIIGSNGLLWHNSRKFALRQLKDLGMGKSRMVSVIQDEACTLVTELKKFCGRPSPLPRAVPVTIFNVAWKLVADRRYEINDPLILRFETLIRNIQGAFNEEMINDIFPWLNNILPKFISEKFLLRSSTQARKEINVFIGDIINEHKAALDVDDPKDFIDAYLIEMKNQENNTDTTMSDRDLLASVGDLYLAGSQTSLSTLNWIIFYLAKHPEIQRRVQKEIDEVLPNGTLANMENRLQLNYCEAVIHEVHRQASFLPSAFVRMASSDINVDGYIIPKGAMVLAMAFHSHYDPKYWDNPNEFNPDRFIDENGKFVYPKEGFLPFGIGKRVCVGETLARMELLIFLTTIFQSVSISAPPGKEINLTPMISNLLARLVDDQQSVLLKLR